MNDDKPCTPPQCPDGGRCHHACADGPCFRVLTCGPLSGVFPSDRWPKSVQAAHDEAEKATP